MRALQLYTLDNAAMAFQEADIGSIQEGKLRNLAVLSQDPLEVAPESIGDNSVDLTVVGGEVAYQTGTAQ